MYKQALFAALTGLARAQTRRHTIRELRALTDMQLADIGVLRGDIPNVVDSLLETGMPARSLQIGRAGRGTQADYPMLRPLVTMP